MRCSWQAAPLAGFYMRTTRMLPYCREEQEKALMKILKANARTEYGECYQFSEIKTREDYVSKHPLKTYADFTEYINRIVEKDEQNVLSHRKVNFISLTSGTTGKNKMYPLSDKIKSDQFGAMILVYFRLTAVSTLKRILSHRLYPKKRCSPSGIPMGGSSLLLGKPLPFNITPSCFTQVTNEKPANYVQCVFALAERELGSMDGLSSNLVLSFFKIMEEHQQELCNDIEKGTVNRHMDIPEEICLELEKELHPDPNRAALLRREFAMGSVGFAKRVWPDMTHVSMLFTGSFALCAKILREGFLKGVQFAGYGHAATEGYVGIPIVGPLDTSIFMFTTSPNFIEFIPLEDVEKKTPNVIFMDQVEIGHLYEIVMTNTFGLYRIRFGDIIKIVGFLKNTPLYEFQYRLGQILAIAFERTPENMLQEAVARCEKLWTGVVVVDFTTCESFVLEEITGKTEKNSCYVFFMALMKDNQPYFLSDLQKQQLDDALAELHEPYSTYRLKGTIAALHVHQVHPETFDDLKHTLWGDYQNVQFKMPRVLRRKHLLEVLLKDEYIFSKEEFCS